MPLHPELRRMLDDTPAEGRSDFVLDLPVAQGVLHLRSRPVAKAEVPGAVPTHDLRLPGPRGELPARLYQPAGARGLLVYFHGGGWTTGSLEQDDFFCQLMARDAGCAVLSVEYGLAPEHPFPEPLDDCLAATRWAAGEATRLGGAGARLAVGGSSAGANLAAAVALRARDEGGPAIDYQVLVSPVCDGGLDFASVVENGQGYGITAATMEWYWQRYAPTPVQRLHPLASILRAPMLAGVPPATVFTCEFDPLRDEGNAYARRLAEAGVAVRHRQLAGMIHGFARRGWDRPWGQEPLAEIAAHLRSALA